MEAFTDNSAVIDYHAADERIGRSEAAALLGEYGGTAQVWVFDPRCDV
jgi:hypothetical protein